MMWAVESAADRVIVMMKSVKANPRRTRTAILPRQRGKEALQHLDRALAVRALLRHLRVDGVGHEEGHEHEKERGQRGEGPRGQGGDPGLIAEGREVVDAGQADHLPPGVLMMVRARARGRTLEEPPPEPGAERRLRRRGPRAATPRRPCLRPAGGCSCSRRLLVPRRLRRIEEPEPRDDGRWPFRGRCGARPRQEADEHPGEQAGYRVRQRGGAQVEEANRRHSHK